MRKSTSSKLKYMYVTNTINQFVHVFFSFPNKQNTEGYNTLRRKFGTDSFLVNGPYSAIMSAFTPPDGSDGLWGFNIPGFSDQNEGPMSTTLPSTAALAQALAQPQPQQNYAAAPYYSQTIPPMSGPSKDFLKYLQFRRMALHYRLWQFDYQTTIR